MKDNIAGELWEDYEIASEGRRCWLSLKEKYDLDMDWYLIICSTENKALNDCAMENLCDFLERKYKYKAVIVSFYNQKEIDINEQAKYWEIKKELLSKKKVDTLVKYYRLLSFFPNIVVISDEEPFGNLNIVGKKEITMHDYVNYALFV